MFTEKIKDNKYFLLILSLIYFFIKIYMCST